MRRRSRARRLFEPAVDIPQEAIPLDGRQQIPLAGRRTCVRAVVVGQPTVPRSFMGFLGQLGRFDG